MGAALELTSDITPREFFERFVVDNFEAITEGKIREVDAVFQVNVTGEGGGTWSMTVREGRMVVRPEADPSALAYMQVDIAAWRELMAMVVGVAQGMAGGVAGVFRFLFPAPPVVQLIKNALRGTAEIALTRDGEEPLRLHFGFKECRPDAPRAKVRMALTDWVDVALRKVVPAQLYMSGKAVVEGDVALAMNMSMLLS